MNPRSLRLAVFASHPIQYQAPVWRRLAKDPRVDLLVHYFSDMSVRGAVDPDFGVPVAWDQPLLDGYRHVFLARDSNLGRPLSVKMWDLEAYLPNFDAVFINGYSYGFELQIRRAAPRLGFALIMRPEVSAIPAGSPFRRFTRRLLQRWFFSGVDAFGVLGEQSRRCLASAGVPPGKMFRSPYAVDSDVFQPNPLGREGARRMLGVSRDRFLLMFSGKLIPGKNPRLVLQALERMPERSRISFLVVGDGPLRAQLEREGRRILGGNILFAGFQNQSRLSTFYQAADAFVLPSEYETWGLVVNEAMRFGLPAVVSDRAGCAADLVQDGHTGLLFRSGDAAGLAAALRRLVASPSFRAECGRNAAALIERYTPDQAANGILEALQSGVGAKRLQRQRTPPSCRSAYTA